ncbi:nucleotidyltransferase family protein [Alsobacter sp. SYSU M60028]|uniref:Nucleotidyltransferase family protein n=1 Tax=Alsobacter ponti TaxID=2962936 RepID=A0ABT1LF01_9HYPH|nr:nucleotidyltransferase family protein [Alsobacter ponti]MCP8938823.1 nucleotidyltransferase family protein [Alsobacter ponti]
MVLAAGLGLRMRPITDTLPKPLVEVGGRTLIDRNLDPLVEAGVRKAVVNVHYRAEQMEAHLARRDRPELVISDERDLLLDSGGGVKKALNLLGPDPFYIVNADSFWIDGPRSNLVRMAEAYDPAAMDMLMLVAPTWTSTGYEGRGDFHMDALGRLQRRTGRDVAPFVYAGVIIVRPEFFADTPEGPFSLNLLFDRAAASGRLHGLRLDGFWLHVGTPASIAEAERKIDESVR